jgi:hypothetical protein
MYINYGAAYLASMRPFCNICRKSVSTSVKKLTQALPPEIEFNIKFINGVGSHLCQFHRHAPALWGELRIRNSLGSLAIHLLSRL